MTASLKVPTNDIDFVAYASINVGTATSSTSTATSSTGAVAMNVTVTPVSYTFSSTPDYYARIFSAQCNRVGTFVYNKLEQLDYGDDDVNEEIIDSIAHVMDLVGEPAVGTVLMEARILEERPRLFEGLLMAIATSRHKETEEDRLQFLRQCAGGQSYRVKRAAVRALGRMHSEGAKRALNEISVRKDQGEISQFATALLR